MFEWKQISRILSFLFLLNFAACGAPKFDMETPEGREAIMFAAKKALTNRDCITAIHLIDPLYNSQYSSNSIRLLRAAAHACYAGVEYFRFIDDLTNSNLVAGELWVSLARLFPYADLPGLSSGWNSVDSLLATLLPTAIVPSAYQINPNSYNMGSLNVGDRTNDANMYLIFASMAVIGRTENRYGAPNASFHKTQNLPWSVPAAMTQEGCAYAGSIVNMIDGITSIINYVSGSVKTSFQLVSTTYSAALSAACETGCLACGFAAGACTPSGTFCPLELRDRANCPAVNTNKATCAANGIVNMVNTDPVLRWP